jgi:hypothetical protein
MVELLLIQSLFKARVFDQLSGGGRQSIHALFEHNIDVYLLIVDIFQIARRAFSLAVCHRVQHKLLSYRRS